MSLKRSETLKRLEAISEMDDREVSINPEWIREVARAAHMHILVLRNLMPTRRRGEGDG